MRIEKLDDGLAEPYSDFLRGSDETLFFATDTYRRLLRAFLDQEDHYLVAMDFTGNVVGALPAFVCRNARLGGVLNSLPFYGSNGGIIEYQGNRDVQRRLLHEFGRLANEFDCVSQTLIDSPLNKSSEVKQYFGGATDSRIGQVNVLPSDSCEDRLFEGYHSKTRNMVRKAMRVGVEVEVDHSPEAFDFLIETHHENMARLGGLAKPRKFFDCVRHYCCEGSEYQLYAARRDGELVAALLLLTSHQAVEYFTPVVRQEARSSQALSSIIHRAMVDSAAQGYRYWNWGGTWKSQDGVYRFKSRWGALDRRYDYYTVLQQPEVTRMSKEQVLAEYPHFYVYPFSQAAEPEQCT